MAARPADVKSGAACFGSMREGRAEARFLLFALPMKKLLTLVFAMGIVLAGCGGEDAGSEAESESALAPLFCFADGLTTDDGCDGCDNCVCIAPDGSAYNRPDWLYIGCQSYPLQ